MEGVIGAGYLQWPQCAGGHWVHNVRR
jgi:hypothetical protein